jgi:hypothetical protein
VGAGKLLYLIGGAARSGKSTLARRLLRARRVSCFCVDYLTSGLEAGAPALGVRHELPDRKRGELVWPVLRGLLRNIVEVEPEYVVEGDVLLPAQIAGFAAAHGAQVRACFLGDSRGTAEAKKASILSFPSEVNDWVGGMADPDLAALVTEIQEFSRYVEAECGRYGLRYFDGGVDFEGALRRAEEYLVGGCGG